MEVHSIQNPDFITITRLKWEPILAKDRFKNIIAVSLKGQVVAK